MRIMLGIKNASRTAARIQSNRWMVAAGMKALGPVYWWISPPSTPKSVKPMPAKMATTATAIISVFGRR